MNSLLGPSYTIYLIEPAHGWVSHQQLRGRGTRETLAIMPLQLWFPTSHSRPLRIFLDQEIFSVVAPATGSFHFQTKKGARTCSPA